MARDDNVKYASEGYVMKSPAIGGGGKSSGGGNAPSRGYGGMQAYNVDMQEIGVKRKLAQIQQMEAEEKRRQFDVQTNAQFASAQQAAGGLTSMVDEYNKAYSQAKGAYEARYQQMLGIADTTTQQRAADIRSSYGQQSADTMQNLARLGMSNTTVAPTMQTGIQREQQSSLNRLADEMQKTKLGIISGHATDQQLAPSTALIQSAITQGQQASGAYGGGLTRALAAMRY